METSLTQLQLKSSDNTGQALRNRILLSYTKIFLIYRTLYMSWGDITLSIMRSGNKQANSLLRALPISLE